MNIEIKGFIHVVNNQTTTTTTKGSYLKQIIVIRKPGFTDEFGDKKGKDQFFPVTLADDACKKFSAQLVKDKKVIATCYLNGYEHNSGNGSQYGLTINLKDLKFL